MTEFESALMNRDDLTKTQAKAERREARNKLYDLLNAGASYSEVEEMMADDYGLEMDYIFDLM